MNAVTPAEGPFRIVARLDEKRRAERLANAIQDLVEPVPDALTLFEDKSVPGGWCMEAYFSAPPDIDALRRTLETLLGEPVPPLEDLAVPERNWVALSQAALPPVRAGRFTVFGSHDRARVPQGPGAILIEAGNAFGTAHHATTLGCLMAIDRLTRRHSARGHRRVLDLGTGSGILALAVARAVPGTTPLGIDIDAPSIVVARENARANRLAARTRFVTGAGLEAPIVRARGPYDLVLANILAEPLVELAPAIRRAVARRATLVLSGLLTHEAPRVAARYRSLGFCIARHHRIGDWSALTLARRPTRPSQVLR